MWVSWMTMAAQAERSMSGCSIPVFFVGKTGHWIICVRQFGQLQLHSWILFLDFEWRGLLCVRLSGCFTDHACNFSLAWVFSCLTLSSVIRAAILFSFPFHKMLASCKNVQKYFSTLAEMLLFSCLLLNSPRIKERLHCCFPFCFSMIIPWGDFSSFD